MFSFCLRHNNLYRYTEKRRRSPPHNSSESRSVKIHYFPLVELFFSNFSLAYFPFEIFVITVKSLLHSASGRERRRSFHSSSFRQLKRRLSACAGALEMSSNCLWKHFHRVFFFGSLIRPLTLRALDGSLLSSSCGGFFYFSARSHPYGMENIFFFFFSFLKNLHFSCTSIPPGEKTSFSTVWVAGRARKFLCATLKHTEEGRCCV